MADLTVQVNASADDAHQWPTTPVLTSTVLNLSSNLQNIGLRFTGITIPKGSTISAANLQLYLYNGSYDTVAATLDGEAADNAAAFTTTDNDISGRSGTTAQAAVNVTDIRTGGSDHYTLVDAKAVVEEIVGRGGWTSGNALVLRLYGYTSGDLRFRSYDNNSAEAPKLVIAYTAPAASGAAKKRKLRQGTRFGAQAGT